MARRRKDHPEQLTLSGWLEGLARRAETPDPTGPAFALFGVVVVMMTVGALVQASHAATILPPPEFRSALSKQVLERGLALAALLAAYRLGPVGIRRFLPALCGLAVLLLVLCYVPPFSVERNGAKRWIDLGIGFQPSEVARVVLVLWIADRCVRLGSRVSELRRGVLPILLWALVFFTLVLCETDLGGALLLLFCALSTMWVGGARPMPIAVSLMALGGGALALGTTLVPYIGQRVSMWLGDVQNDQVSEAVRAIGGGGLLGVGLGHGTARSAGVPHLQSDYVFAQIGEELGLLGLLLVLGLLLSFLWHALRLVLSIRDRYQALAAFGLLLSVGLQAMIHVQVVSGLAPPKGTILPFVSDGGTSLVVSSLAVGLALGAARERVAPARLSALVR